MKIRQFTPEVVAITYAIALIGVSLVSGIGMANGANAIAYIPSIMAGKYVPMANSMAIGVLLLVNIAQYILTKYISLEDGIQKREIVPMLTLLALASIEVFGLMIAIIAPDLVEYLGSPGGATRMIWERISNNPGISATVFVFCLLMAIGPEIVLRFFEKIIQNADYNSSEQGKIASFILERHVALSTFGYLALSFIFAFNFTGPSTGAVQNQDRKPVATNAPVRQQAQFVQPVATAVPAPPQAAVPAPPQAPARQTSPQAQAAPAAGFVDDPGYNNCMTTQRHWVVKLTYNANGSGLTCQSKSSETQWSLNGRRVATVKH